MKNKLWLISLLFVTACSNEDAKVTEAEVADSIVVEDETYIPALLPWVSNFDTVKNEFYLHQQRKSDLDSLKTEDLIKDLNAYWESVQLQVVKTSNDTLYVAIPDADYLSSQMGSAGAQAYMATTTYNLTELRGIRYVNYSMKGGDHAMPGTFSRKSFENYR